MWEYPAFKRFLERHGSRVFRVKLQMGAFGLGAVKDTVLLGSAPYLPSLQRRLDPAERRALEDGRLQVVHKYTDAQGRKHCHGAADLKATQSYPLGFGAAHALAFQAWDAPATAGAASSSSAPPASSSSAPASSQLAGEWSDDEDDWYMDDLRQWNPARWHSNTRGEHQLALKQLGDEGPRAKRPR